MSEHGDLRSGDGRDDGGPNPVVAWKDGRLIPAADATVHVLSHMAARGSQVFDVLLVTATGDGPCAVGLRPHVARFVRSADLMGMASVGEVGALERAVAETVMANLPDDFGPEDGSGGAMVVKLVAAWVEQPVGLTPGRIEPTVFVLATPYAGVQRVDAPRTPAAVKSVTMPKIPASILPPSLKVAAAYTPGVREHLAAQAEGYDYIVMRTLGGDLAESTTSSMVVVADGRIMAPPLDTVLDGITRRLVFDAAAALELPSEVRAVGWDEVTGADELLLSSTNNPVLPVGRLDDAAFEAPGPITAGLGQVVGEVLRGRHPLAERWLTPLSTMG